MADATTPTQDTPLTPHAALRAEIADRLASSGKDVRDLVISDLTKVEIDRRAGAVKVIITKLDEKTKELKKAENGGSSNYNAEGDKIGDPVFTKDQAESMKKIRDEITKLQGALEKAFKDGDFSKVLELGKDAGK